MGRESKKKRKANAGREKGKIENCEKFPLELESKTDGQKARARGYRTKAGGTTFNTAKK